MNMEKEIEEVRDIIARIVVGHEKEVWGIEAAARQIIARAGYRKADEVRRETAKELFDLIEEEYKRAEMLSGNDIHFKCGVLDGLCDILDMFHQKFGFEVDE